MIIKKSLLLFGLIIFSLLGFAQTNYEIETTSTSENFNSKGELISKRVWASGTQGGDKMDVELILSPRGKVMKLTINGEKVKPLFFKEYRILTDYLIDYVRKEKEYVAPVQTRGLVRVVSDNPDASKLLTDDKKEKLIKKFKEELLLDELVEDIQVFQLMITSSDLYINGKEQTEDMFLKYKAIYDEHSPVALSKTTYFQIMQSL
jgi:hypothetical protein